MSDSSKPPGVTSSKVWTVLITNTDYLPGLLTLEFSLRRVQSRYPLVALYTNSFPPCGLAALTTRGIPSQRVENLQPPIPSDNNGSVDIYNYPHDPRFRECWTKLVPFSLTQYARVVQLDADMLVLRNMDELMDLPLDDNQLEHSPAVTTAEYGSRSEETDKNNNGRVFAASYACLCNPLHKPHYPPSWQPKNCPFTSQHSDPDSAQTEAPNPNDPMTSPLGGDLNGGLQVVRPDKQTFEQITAFMQQLSLPPSRSRAETQTETETERKEENKRRRTMEFADQSLLSELFRGRWVALPYVYNALKTMRWDGVHADIWRDGEVRCVHYILTPKPWEGEVGGGKTKEGLGGDDVTTGWWWEADGERRRSERERGFAIDGY